ncbi:MAG: 6-phosphogluconolactonase [Planctomycetales bacterium]
MQYEILPDSLAVGQRGAALVAQAARQAVQDRGQFLLAVSGGSTPWQMLSQLAAEALPWEQVQILQVDERAAPQDHSERNLTHLRACLAAQPAFRENQLHAMPVLESELEDGALHYARLLERLAGMPPVLDLVHLGLGTDGHTASLVPGDPVLGVQDRDVAAAGIYQGRRRLTLTYPLINRARQILWLVTGASKRDMLNRLLKSDATIPAGRVRPTEAIVLADQDAAGQ